MKRILFLVIFTGIVWLTFAQQIAIPRIDQMPDLPSPYLMRDWKQVAVDYDNLIFDITKSGTHLPVTKISTSDGVNYPALKTIRMDTYVGQSNHGNVAEAINILPAIVGATLVGVDKTSHMNINWVEKIKDFYNRKNGQNVYLNSYSGTTGNDWWYEVMPNVFFYQLYSLYPTADADFEAQFNTIADRQLKVVHQLGGKVQPWTLPEMNYRAFNLITGKPNTSSVPEPETAGSIAWILYQAYAQTGNPKYLQGAELSLEFLLRRTSNPSYEIQLPYGIAAAARMNAVEGTAYDLEKMMNWAFSSGQNTLRGWGSIVGKWNGYDVSGLIGEANDKGDDYAFSMNGFQHAAALAPVAKYDKRFAHAIAKWILNVANASRLFYPNALPQANQEATSYAWSKQNDPTACIPFESIKQNWNGTQPKAMGDAVKGGWAATDLSLYSGSSVGYMAGIIQKTNIDGILQIDLNKTDFRADNAYPHYLYYNPTTTVQSVQINLPTGSFDIYDMISESVLKSNVSGTTDFSIAADNVRLLVLYPAGKTPVLKGRLKLVDEHVIDYNTGYNFSGSLRIKAFSASDTIVQKSNALQLYCLTENARSTNLSYQWFQNDALISTSNTGSFNWQAPAVAGNYLLQCRVSENGDTISSPTISIQVVDKLSIAPVISDISFSAPMPFSINATQSPVAILNTTDVAYVWSTTDGTLTNQLSASPVWNLPASPGIYSLSLTVANSSGSSTFTKSVLLKDFSPVEEPATLIYYPFNGDTKNKAQEELNAIAVNPIASTGANGIANAAYQFPSSASYMYTPNEPALNFQDKIAISLWVKADALPNNEQFILSHGSWEERYKLSITPEKKVRWTVKTTQSVVDVDADTMLRAGEFTHFTVVYTGYSSELYRNGKLSAFKPLTGSMRTTGKSLTIARKDEGTTDYSFKGAVDEVRMYNAELSPQLIQLLPATFKIKAGNDDTTATAFQVYPNPFSTELHIALPANETLTEIEVFDLAGRKILHTTQLDTAFITNIPNGFYLLQVGTDAGKVYKTKIMKH